MAAVTLVGALAERILQGLLGSEALHRWRSGEPPSMDVLGGLGSARSAELARLATATDLREVSPAQLLALAPQGVTLGITWAHLLTERPMGRLLWELRACVTGAEGKVALILSTFPATENLVIGPQAAFFGVGEKLQIEDPTAERWRELVYVHQLPVTEPDLMWLLLRSEGQARATSEILALTRSAPVDAQWAVRGVWEQKVESMPGSASSTVSFARAVTPHGATLMSAIAAEQGPYRVLRRYASAKQIARALGQLAYYGLIYSPRRGRWLLGNPLLRDALTSPDPHV
jgi:hypothetical protein